MERKKKTRKRLGPFGEMKRMRETVRVLLYLVTRVMKRRPCSMYGLFSQ